MNNIEQAHSLSNDNNIIERMSNEIFSLNNNNRDLVSTGRCFESNLDGIYSNISKMINLEKKKIQKEKDYIQKASKEFNDYKAKEIIKIENEKTLLKEKYKLNNTVKENDIIDINIGGTDSVTTKRATLIKVYIIYIIYII